MYRKNNVPFEPAQLSTFLNQELSEIERAQYDPMNTVSLAILHAEPKVPTSGRNVILAEADGTDWNPGSGAGLYCYRGGTWVFIG